MPNPVEGPAGPDVPQLPHPPHRPAPVRSARLTRRTRLRTILAAVSLAVLAACSGPSPTATTTSASTSPPSNSTAHSVVTTPQPSASTSRPVQADTGDWTTYHHDGARSGVAPHVTTGTKLSVAWRAHLDGAVYGEPLVLGDSVYVATEHDSIYRLDRRTGATQWRRHVGTPVPLSELPCGDIDPLGITGTPVIDRPDGRIFAVAETTDYHHVLVGLDLVTGRIEVRRDIPTPDGHPRFDQQRPALALTDGRIYVDFGGLFGDCGTYTGSVVGIPVSGRGPAVSWTVPTTNNGAVWATGGPVVTPRGNLLVSVGNGAATRSSQAYDGSDSVVELSPGLHRIDFFAPKSWAADNAGDLDLGSLTPALTDSGRVMIAGKRGTAYLLDAHHLGGIGGAIAEAALCHGFGTPAHRGDTVYLPCVDGGLAAVDTSGGRIDVRWRGPADGNGSPVIGGGSVWVASWDSGVLYALDPQTGEVRGQIDTGATLPHFVSPSLSGNLVLLGTTHGVVAVRH